MRRCPPPRSATELEPLCCALTDALEAGELTIPLTDEQHALVIASGWLEQANCPLRLEGQRIGWRRWVDAMDSVIDELIERAARLPADRRSDGIAEPAETLNPEQRQAVLALDQVSVLLISGGPGTGKTSTVVEVLLRAISRTPTLRVGLAAPRERPRADWARLCSQGFSSCPASPCTVGWRRDGMGSDAISVARLISI